MANQHSISLARKRELDQPDEFITFSKKTLEYIVEHKNIIVTVICLILGVVLVGSGYKYFKVKSAISASSMLEQASIKYDQAVKADGPVKAMVGVEPDFVNIIDKYGNTAAGKVAQLSYGNICYKAGEFDKAIEAFKQALNAFEDDSAIKTLIYCDIGYAFEAKKDNQNAIDYFNRIVQGEQIIKKDEALYNLARIYRESGDTEKAKKYYEQIVADFPNSIYINIVKERLAVG